jgi:hypothetical protein
MKSFEIGQRVRIVDPAYLCRNSFDAPEEGVVTAIDSHRPWYEPGHASIALLNDAEKRSFVAFPSDCELVDEEKKAYEGTPAIGASPSQGFLHLATLYLETYSQLAEEDKQLYRRLIHLLVNPLLKYKETV